MPGHRIRFVIAWDSCPGAALGTAPAPVATDIDLFLVRDNLVVAGSQAVKDVTEGFDITVPTAGSYSVWWAAPDGPGCSGNGHEPLGWAYAVWGP